ncbi:MAG: hypothetical protein ACLSDQ_03250 [Adlercreutzia equolifaciens]
MGVVSEGRPEVARVLHRRWRQPQFFSPARFLSVWGGGNFFEPGCAQCYLPRNHMEFCLNGTADTSLADGPVTEVYLPTARPSATSCGAWALPPTASAPRAVWSRSCEMPV